MTIDQISEESINSIRAEKASFLPMETEKTKKYYFLNEKSQKLTFINNVSFSKQKMKLTIVG
jgi:hypothetical protein